MEIKNKDNVSMSRIEIALNLLKIRKKVLELKIIKVRLVNHPIN